MAARTPKSSKADPGLRRKTRAQARSQRPAASRGKARAASERSLKLAPECMLAQLPTLHSTLSAAIASEGVVTLDAGDIRRIDAASLQLLGAFVRDRRKHGRTVAWKGVTPSLDRAARLAGLHTLLGLPSAGAAAT